MKRRFTWVPAGAAALACLGLGCAGEVTVVGAGGGAPASAKDSTDTSPGAATPASAPIGPCAPPGEPGPIFGSPCAPVGLRCRQGANNDCDFVYACDANGQWIADPEPDPWCCPGLTDEDKCHAHGCTWSAGTCHV